MTYLYVWILWTQIDMRCYTKTLKNRKTVGFYNLAEQLRILKKITGTLIF